MINMTSDELAVEIQRLQEHRNLLIQYLYEKVPQFEAIPRHIVEILDEVELRKRDD